MKRSGWLAADEGMQRMAAMIQAMQSIQASGAGIAAIAKTIDEIAFQTNLLTLNAAIELDAPATATRDAVQGLRVLVHGSGHTAGGVRRDGASATGHLGPGALPRMGQERSGLIGATAVRIGPPISVCGR